MLLSVVDPDFQYVDIPYQLLAGLTPKQKKIARFIEKNSQVRGEGSLGTRLNRFSGFLFFRITEQAFNQREVALAFNLTTTEAYDEIGKVASHVYHLYAKSFETPVSRSAQQR